MTDKQHDSEYEARAERVRQYIDGDSAGDYDPYDDLAEMTAYVDELRALYGGAEQISAARLRRLNDAVAESAELRKALERVQAKMDVEPLDWRYGCKQIIRAALAQQHTEERCPRCKGTRNQPNFKWITGSKLYCDHPFHTQPEEG